MNARALRQQINRQEYLTVQEFAFLCRFHVMSVYRMVRFNRVPGVVRIGRQIRFVRAEALAFKRTLDDGTAV